MRQFAIITIFAVLIVANAISANPPVQQRGQAMEFLLVLAVLWLVFVPFTALSLHLRARSKSSSAGRSRGPPTNGTPQPTRRRC